MSRHAATALRPHRHRRRFVAILVVLALAVAVTAGAFLLRPDHTRPGPEPAQTQALSAAAHQAAAVTLTELVARADTVAVHVTAVLGPTASDPLTAVRRHCAAMTSNSSATTAQVKTCEHRLAVAIGAATAAVAGK